MFRAEPSEELFSIAAPRRHGTDRHFAIRFPRKPGENDPRDFGFSSENIFSNKILARSKKGREGETRRRSQITIGEVVRNSKRRNGETTDGLIIAKSIATFYNKPIFLFLLFSSSFLRYNEINANGRLLRGKASLCARDRLPFQKLNEREPEGGKPSKRTNYIRLICA